MCTATPPPAPERVKKRRYHRNSHADVDKKGLADSDNDHRHPSGEARPRSAKREKSKAPPSPSQVTREYREDAPPCPDQPPTSEGATAQELHLSDRSISAPPSASSIVIINVNTGAREHVDDVYLDADENVSGDAQEVNTTVNPTAADAKTTAARAQVVKEALPQPAAFTILSSTEDVPRIANPLARGPSPTPVLLLPLAATSGSRRLSVGDIQTLVGPLEDYEQRFGDLYCTGESPFVVERRRVRGTVGHPLPQPDQTERSHSRARAHAPVRLVGAVYVARQVPSPDWGALGSHRKVMLSPKSRARAEQRKASPDEDEDYDY